MLIEIFNRMIKTKITNIKKEKRAIKLLEFKKSLIPLPLPALSENGFHGDEFCGLFICGLFILSYIYIIKEKAIITK